ATAEDEAAADAGADGEHHEVRGHEVALGVERLRERCAGRVVLDVDGDPGLVGEQLAQRQVGERDVDAVGDPPGLDLDDGRQPHAGRDGVVGPQVGNQVDELGDERV